MTINYQSHPPSVYMCVCAYTYICVCVCVFGLVLFLLFKVISAIYIYIYIYVCKYNKNVFRKSKSLKNMIKYIRNLYEVHMISFQTFFVGVFKILKIQYVIAIDLMRWLTNFCDFRFKWTARSGIGMYPTKAWLSQLVNFKNAIRHFRRMIYNKIVF